jgi:hypothetical protein
MKMIIKEKKNIRKGYRTDLLLKSGKIVFLGPGKDNYFKLEKLSLRVK